MTIPEVKRKHSDTQYPITLIVTYQFIVDNSIEGKFSILSTSCKTLLPAQLRWVADCTAVIVRLYTCLMTRSAMSEEHSSCNTV